MVTVAISAVGRENLENRTVLKLQVYLVFIHTFTQTNRIYFNLKIFLTSLSSVEQISIFIYLFLFYKSYFIDLFLPSGVSRTVINEALNRLNKRNDPRKMSVTTDDSTAKTKG